MKQQKYYAVRKGRKEGIFRTLDECPKYVNGYEKAEFKSFKTEEEAKQFMQGVDPTYKQYEDSEVPIFIVEGFYNKDLDNISYGMVVIFPKGRELKFAKLVSNTGHSKTKETIGELFGIIDAIRLADAKNLTSIVIKHRLQGMERWFTGDKKIKNGEPELYRNFFNSYKGKIEVKFERSIRNHMIDI